jgi:ATP-binding cassette subfamily B protein
MFLSAIAEVMSIGAVIPFIAVITDPDKMNEIALLGAVLNFFDITENQDAVLFFTVVFITLAIVSGIIRVFYIWIQSRLTQLITADFSITGFRKSLYQPYSVHVKRNSSEVVSTIFVKLNRLSYKIILPCFAVTSSSIIILSVFLAFLYIDFSRTILIFLSFASVYLFFTFIFKNPLNKGSTILSEEQDKAVKILQESFGGIRDVLIDGTHELYINLFSRSETLIKKTISHLEFMALSPRYIIEMFGITIFAIFCSYSVLKGVDSTYILPVLGSVVVAAVKLLPYVQQTYAGLSNIRGHRKLVEDILLLLDQESEDLIVDASETSKEKFFFNDKIELADLCFSYNSNEKNIIKNIDITIPAGSKVGIIGQTGSGKSTLIDILMGLLLPDSGSFKIDGKELNNNNQHLWRKKVVHVPQNIYLSDLSIKENIVFGHSNSKENYEKMVSASKKANIHEYIESLEDGYRTLVGERGVKLSGGQRQRIGIARALYRDPDILFLDEATNALDDQTEELIMKSLYEFNKNLTLIMVAHRKTTLKHCSIIIELKDGTISKIGSYEDVIGS